MFHLVGEARSKGPEVDIQGELLPGWNVIAHLYEPGRPHHAGQVDGQPARAASRPVSASLMCRAISRELWTTYEFQDASLKGLKVGAGYTYHGSQPLFDRSGGASGRAPLLSSWGTVDLMAAYTFDLDGVKTTAQINVTNLFNKTYYTDAGR